jgi:hypothetical protein
MSKVQINNRVGKGKISDEAQKKASPILETLSKFYTSPGISPHLLISVPLIIGIPAFHLPFTF